MWEFLRPTLHRSLPQRGGQSQPAPQIDLPAPVDSQPASASAPEAPSAMSTPPSEESRPPAEAQQPQASHEVLPKAVDVARDPEPDRPLQEIEDETGNEVNTPQDSEPPTVGSMRGLAGRRRGRRLVKPEHVKAPPLSAEQRLLLLDTWRRSGLPAGDFAALVGLSKHTLYAWKKKFDTNGPAGLMQERRGGPKGSRMPEPTKRGEEKRTQLVFCVTCPAGSVIYTTTLTCNSDAWLKTEMQKRSGVLLQGPARFEESKGEISISPDGPSG